MDSGSDEDIDKVISSHERITEMVLKEKRENPSFFVSHWDADEEVDIDTAEDRKNSKEKQFLYAAEHGDNETLNVLMKEKRELISCRDSDGYTPLHRACYEGHLDTVKLLLSNGANINAQTAEGWTPLHSACFWGQVHVVSLLLHHKHCHLNAVTNGNQTALHLTAQNSSNLKLFQLLLLNPFIDTSIVNSSNETARNIAERNYRYSEIFEVTDSDINLM